MNFFTEYDTRTSAVLIARGDDQLLKIMKPVAQRELYDYLNNG